MTISGWIIFGFLAISTIIVTVSVTLVCDSSIGKCCTVVLAIIIIFATLFGMLWYFNNTASGQRAFVDEKSEIRNGIERVINVYTADGELIAHYSGRIDIDTNDGGYVKFDFEGKRYIYYNCFIESIAEIE